MAEGSTAVSIPAGLVYMLNVYEGLEYIRDVSCTSNEQHIDTKFSSTASPVVRRSIAIWYVKWELMVLKISQASHLAMLLSKRKTRYGLNMAEVFDGYSEERAGSSTKAAEQLHHYVEPACSEIIFQDCTVIEVVQKTFLSNRKNK
ncbi:hypothetical protein J6590_002147 [Homalodisca vitripennis]|nr:hypothetical protein J6590_002147 [Homalodisca vitripennis]